MKRFVLIASVVAAALMAVPAHAAVSIDAAPQMLPFDQVELLPAEACLDQASSPSAAVYVESTVNCDPALAEVTGLCLEAVSDPGQLIADALSKGLPVAVTCLTLPPAPPG